MVQTWAKKSPGKEFLAPNVWLLLETMNEDLILIKRLESLRAEHRELDDVIKQDTLDEFSRKRYQKLKLSMRDEIIKLEHEIYPDITA
jgi:hypothetical protein